MKVALTTVLAGTLLVLSNVGLAKGDAEKGKALAASCSACHGADGNSTNPEWPKLAGQSEAYLVKQLNDYRSGKRENAVMNGMAKAIPSDEAVEHLAAYFASQAAEPGVADPEAKVEEGRLLYKGGKISTGVTACAACHGPTGNGNDGAKFPKISGQHSKYLMTQLRDFREGTRANDSNKMMQDIANRMSDKDMRAVVEYIAGLRD